MTVISVTKLGNLALQKVAQEEFGLKAEIRKEHIPFDEILQNFHSRGSGPFHGMSFGNTTILFLYHWRYGLVKISNDLLKGYDEREGEPFSLGEALTESIISRCGEDRDVTIPKASHIGIYNKNYSEMDSLANDGFECFRIYRLPTRVYQSLLRKNKPAETK